MIAIGESDPQKGEFLCCGADDPTGIPSLLHTLVIMRRDVEAFIILIRSSSLALSVRDDDDKLPIQSFVYYLGEEASSAMGAQPFVLSMRA